MSTPAGSFIDEGELRFRLATAIDVPCLSALATQVFLETYATSGIRVAFVREVESHFSVEAFERLLAHPGRRILLVERAGHLIAFAEVALAARHALVPQVRAAELTRLYVQSPFVRRAVGRRLLARVEGLARAEGASTLWLTAWVGNQRALGFYASQGYDELGSTDYMFEGEAYENRLFAKALRAEI